LKYSFIAAALALAVVSFEAGAQVSTMKPVQFGIAGGGSIPTSDLSNGANTGFNVTGTVGVNPQLIPLGIRIDGAYNRFGLKNGASGDIHFTSVTGNLVYKFPSPTLSPYAIGGAGWYNAAVNLTDSAVGPTTTSAGTWAAESPCR